MAAEVSADLNVINDEDLLRRMVSTLLVDGYIIFLELHGSKRDRVDDGRYVVF